MRARLSDPTGNGIKNEKIDAEEDIKGVVIRECLLNVATSSLAFGGKLTYVELNFGSFPEASETDKDGEPRGPEKNRKRESLEKLTGTRRTRPEGSQR